MLIRNIVQRVWILLEEKGIPYQYIEVNPYEKPASLLSLNPKGLVPTLSCSLKVDGKQVLKPLYESNIINDYLEEVYYFYGSKFYPSDPYDKAKGRIWADFVTSRIIPGFHRFLQHQGGTEELDAARQDFLGYLKEFTRAMDGDGPFFHGKEFMMTDITIAPWVVRLWVFDHFKEGGLGIPAPGEGGDDEEVWKRWRKWLDAIESRHSVSATMSEREHYLPIYKRYADDKTQSELAKSIRAGKGVV